MGGEARRRKEIREAQGLPDEGFRVRIAEPAWLARKKEKIARRGVLLPIPASTRNLRRRGVKGKDEDGNERKYQAQMPVTAEQAEMIFGPIREHNGKVRRGEVPRTERLEVTMTEANDEPAQPAEDVAAAGPDPA